MNEQRRMKIFEKEYNSEALGQDVSRDIWESFHPDFNPIMNDVPQDEHGFLKGTFKLTIEWIEE